MDFEVNYIYLSALTSFLGCRRTAQALVRPSYQACLYYCVERFTSRWAQIDDPEVIRAAGFTAAIASREVWDRDRDSDSRILQTQLGRSLRSAMTAQWTDLIQYRLAAVSLASRYGFMDHFKISNS